MANIIQGDASVFKSAIFGQPDYKTLEFLSNQYNNLSQYATATSNQFFSAAKETYERISGSTAMRAARAAGRKIRSMWDNDEIKELMTIGEMQFAKPTMQRWIMANPFVRQLYQEQRIDGYSGSYIDNYEGDIGVDHYDYRRVMNGIVHEKDDKLIAITYCEDLVDERELDIDEQVEIHNTWNRMSLLIKYGKEDPTSKWAAEL